MRSLPSAPTPLASARPSSHEVQRAQRLLIAYGIPAHETETIHILVADARSRSNARGVASHCHSGPIPLNGLRMLADGVFVAGPELCFAQMAQVLTDERELIEFGFELCGSYEHDVTAGNGYRERPALSTTSRLSGTLEGLSGLAGIKTARWALRYVRDGSRSPMETAHIMTLVLPKRIGGLGIRGIEMNYRIDIPTHLRHLVRTRYVVCDGYLPARRLDLEYNGFHHNEEARKAADEERRNVLEAMGHYVKILTKATFFDCKNYRRHLLAVMAIAEVRDCRLPERFWEHQEELRRFVLRRWLLPQRTPRERKN